MTDEQLLRYSRHILLDEIGIEAQARICASHALIVGLGGLGSPAALYLASAGVGTLSLVDHDTVEPTNLQRQIVHNEVSLGQLKVASAKERLSAMNSHITVNAYAERADAVLFDALVAGADVVLDCTDNFETRHAINRACVLHKKPLVSGAAVRFDGQLMVFDTRGQTPSPCYACVFPEAQAPEALDCAVMGVFAPLVGIIGAMQAAEALKLLGGFGAPAVGQLQMLDATCMQWQSLRVTHDPHCAVCGKSKKL
jgi:molybdopterin-synthase adenylyltransferase